MRVAKTPLKINSGRLHVGVVRDGHHKGQHQLRHQIADPHCRRFGYANLGNRQQPAAPGQQHAKGDQVHQRALLAHRPGGPKANHAYRKIHARHEPVYVVQARRRGGLT
jgi:hypothetical protein